MGRTLRFGFHKNLQHVANPSTTCTIATALEGEDKQTNKQTDKTKKISILVQNNDLVRDQINDVESTVFNTVDTRAA